MLVPGPGDLDPVAAGHRYYRQQIPCCLTTTKRDHFTHYQRDCGEKVSLLPRKEARSSHDLSQSFGIAVTVFLAEALKNIS